MPKDPVRYGKNALLGVILCGGASRRMGVDKATLPYAGRALWHQIAERLAPQVAQLAISVSATQPPQVFAPVPCIEDTQFNCGPLAGIASSFESPAWQTFEWLVFSSCDTPLQPYDWVQHLLNAAEGRAGIYYIRSQGQHHYLHALWHRSMLANLTEFLLTGERAVRAFYAQNNALPVDYATAHPCQADPFLNLNTPEDLTRLNHD